LKTSSLDRKSQNFYFQRWIGLEEPRFVVPQMFEGTDAVEKMLLVLSSVKVRNQQVEIWRPSVAPFVV